YRSIIRRPLGLLSPDVDCVFMLRVRATAGVAIRTVRRDVALDLTAAKREELVDLARRFGRGRSAYIDAYWHPMFMATICDPRLRVVQSQRKIGWLVRDLSAHQNKVCLETSIAALRSRWAGALAAARRVVSRDRNWEHDRDWALATLRSVDEVPTVR